MRSLALLPLLAACSSDGDPPPVHADTDADPVVETDTDTPADTEVLADTFDSGVPAPPLAPVDTATPLEAVDAAPIRGAWAPRGGARLRAVFLHVEGADEAVFSHFHDEVTDVDCRFRVAADGEVRCLPLAGGARAETSADGTTDVGLLVPGTCGPAPLRPVERSGGSEDCGASRHVVQRYAPDPTVHATVEDPLSDRKYTLPIPDGTVFWRPTHRVPPWRFARGLARVVPVTDGLGVVVVRAEDGAVEPIGLFDRRRRAPCVPKASGADGPGVWRCVPTTEVEVDRSGHYADEACTELALQATCDAPGPEPLSAASASLDRAFLLDELLHVRVGERDFSDRPDQDPVSTWVELGEVVDPVWLGGGGDCAPEAVVEDSGTWGDDRTTWRRALGPVDRTQLPRLTLRAAPHGRPGAKVLVADDGAVLLPWLGTPFTGEDGVDCVPQWDPDGRTARCVSVEVPEEPYFIEGVYADPDCGRRLVWATPADVVDGVYRATRSPWVVERAVDRDCLGPLDDVGRGVLLRPWARFFGDRVHVWRWDGGGGSSCQAMATSLVWGPPGATLHFPVFAVDAFAAYPELTLR